MDLVKLSGTQGVTFGSGTESFSSSLAKLEQGLHVNQITGTGGIRILSFCPSFLFCGIVIAFGHIDVSLNNVTNIVISLSMQCFRPLSNFAYGCPGGLFNCYIYLPRYLDICCSETQMKLRTK